MTEYEALMRRHTNAAEIVRLEKAAWQEYRGYLINKMSPSMNAVKGDATSHLLFRKWQAIRARRDGIRYLRQNQFRRQA